MVIKTDSIILSIKAMFLDSFERSFTCVRDYYKTNDSIFMDIFYIWVESVLR